MFSWVALFPTELRELFQHMQFENTVIPSDWIKTNIRNVLKMRERESTM